MSRVNKLHLGASSVLVNGRKRISIETNTYEFDGLQFADTELHMFVREVSHAIKSTTGGELGWVNGYPYYVTWSLGAKTKFTTYKLVN